MPTQIAWTNQADTHLLRLRADGLPWHAVASKLNVGRNAVIERSRRLGLRPLTHVQPAPRPIPERNDRPALPAGHPISWRAITDSTPLQDEPYPYPVFL